jgi:molybdopterin molybdotransferase
VAPLPANRERKDYLRATLAPGADGGTLATPIAAQDSSLAKALARADALLIREPGAPAAMAGGTCRIVRLAPLGA